MIINVLVIPWGFNLFGRGWRSGWLHICTSQSVCLNLSLEVIISKALSISVILFCSSNIVLTRLIFNPLCIDLIITSYSLWQSLLIKKLFCESLNSLLVLI